MTQIKILKNEKWAVDEKKWQVDRGKHQQQQHQQHCVASNNCCPCNAFMVSDCWNDYIISDTLTFYLCFFSKSLSKSKQTPWFRVFLWFPLWPAKTNLQLQLQKSCVEALYATFIERKNKLWILRRALHCINRLVFWPLAASGGFPNVHLLYFRLNQLSKQMV